MADRTAQAVALYAELNPRHTFAAESIADVARRLETTDPETLKAELIAEAVAVVRAAAAVIRALPDAGERAA